MSPDLFFWYALAFKVAMTATIVVLVSVAAERSGPFIAALIAALPTAAGATYILLALEHPPAFIAASAIGSMAANAAVAIFALTYAALAQHQPRRRAQLNCGNIRVVCHHGGLAISRVDARRHAHPQCDRLRFHHPPLCALPRRRGAEGRRQADPLRPPAAGSGSRAGRRAASAAAHRLTWRAALLLDRELLLADHLGPFAGLRLDVIRELFR